MSCGCMDSPVLAVLETGVLFGVKLWDKHWLHLSTILIVKQHTRVDLGLLKIAASHFSTLASTGELHFS